MHAFKFNELIILPITPRNIRTIYVCEECKKRQEKHKCFKTIRKRDVMSLQKKLKILGFY